MGTNSTRKQEKTAGTGVPKPQTQGADLYSDLAVTPMEGLGLQQVQSDV